MNCFVDKNKKLKTMNGFASDEILILYAGYHNSQCNVLGPTFVLYISSRYI